jgi:hypothetical protein
MTTHDYEAASLAESGTHSHGLPGEDAVRQAAAVLFERVTSESDDALEDAVAESWPGGWSAWDDLTDSNSPKATAHKRNVRRRVLLALSAYCTDAAREIEATR